MKPVILHPQARRELGEAARFLERRRVGVGNSLLAEFYAAVARIAAMPMSGPPGEAGTRRLLLQRFRYTVIYVIHEAEIEILAVAHQSRRPGYWRRRLPKRR